MPYSLSYIILYTEWFGPGGRVGGWGALDASLAWEGRYRYYYVDTYGEASSERGEFFDARPSGGLACRHVGLTAFRVVS